MITAATDLGNPPFQATATLPNTTKSAKSRYPDPILADFSRKTLITGPLMTSGKRRKLRQAGRSAATSQIAGFTRQMNPAMILTGSAARGTVGVNGHADVLIGI
jgi:predicted glycosyltransferase